MSKSHIGSILPIYSTCATNWSTLLYDDCIKFVYNDGTKLTFDYNTKLLGSTLLDPSSSKYTDYIYNSNVYKINPNNVIIDKEDFYYYKINDIITTNIITDPTDPSKWFMNKDTNYGFVSHSTINNLYKGYTGYERTVKGSDYRGTFIGIPWSTPTDMSKPLTFSIYARCVKNPQNACIELNYEGKDASNNRVDIIKNIYFTDYSWQRISLTDIPNTKNFSSLVSYMKVYLKSNDSNIETTIQICMPQAEFNKKSPTSFIIGSRNPNTQPAGLCYKLEYTPQSIFFLFKSSYTYTNGDVPASDMPIFEMPEENINNANLRLYAEATTGYPHLKISSTDGKIYHVVINKNILDGEWHTISIHLNEFREVKGILQKPGYTARLVVDDIIESNDYYDQAVTFINNTVNQSSEPFSAPLSFSRYLAFGYSKDGLIGNMFISKIRADAKLYTKDEIRWIHNSYNNMIDVNNFIGKAW